MGATCSHTLMRAAEVLDLMDCGEAIMNAALARQETRANHVRSDFPFTNPLLADKFLTVGLEVDEVVAGLAPHPPAGFPLAPKKRGTPRRRSPHGKSLPRAEPSRPSAIIPLEPPCPPQPLPHSVGRSPSSPLARFSASL